MKDRTDEHRASNADERQQCPLLWLHLCYNKRKLITGFFPLRPSIGKHTDIKYLKERVGIKPDLQKIDDIENHTDNSCRKTKLVFFNGEPNAQQVEDNSKEFYPGNLKSKKHHEASISE